MAKSIFVQREVEEIYESYVKYDWIYGTTSSREHYIKKPKSMICDILVKIMY